MRKRPCVFIACVFLTGLLYQRYDSAAWVGIFSLLLMWDIICGVKSKRFKMTAGRSIVLLSAFLIGAGHMQMEENFRDAYMSKLEDGSRITVWGEISKIESTDTGVRAILSDCYISLKEETIPCNNIMVYASSDHFQVGQIQKITGEMNTFSKAENQGNFDSLVFYQSQKIDFSIYEEESILLRENDSAGKTFLLSVKEKMQAVYENCMEEKAAGFYSAMVLGDKSNLDEELKDLFTMAGISHILAISGLHVSIIGRGFYKQLRKRKIGFLIAGILSSGLLLSYCYMVGNGMSVVRAVGMMLLFFFGQCLGRSYDMLNALGMMCLLLLWDNPFLIEYSGFWFSVTALVGVGFVGSTLSDSVKKGKSFWMSLGITFTTLPITALCYYEIPLYAPLANFIVLPILTPIFILALTGGVIGILLPFLGQIFLLPCQWGVLFFEWICTLVGKLPGASLICGQPAESTIVIYYLILFLGILALRHWEKRAVWYLASCVVCLFLLVYPKNHAFEITFLSVGQGAGTYISTGDDTTYFIDGGSTSTSGVGEYRILPFLKSKGVSSVDYWFVTHADTDHVSGLEECMESGYEIAHLVVAEYAVEDDNYVELLALAEAYDIEVIHMKPGDKIQSEKSCITCYYPWEIATDDANEASFVLQLEVSVGEEEVRALFTGDISAETEALILEKKVLDEVDIYAAAHHGSNYSNSEALLSEINPEIIVVSCGKNNIYGHPGEKAVKRMENSGADIYYTMDIGQVTIQYDEAKKGLVTEVHLLLQ